MKFFEAANRLACEVLSLKRYKKMHIALAVFVGIFLAPFYIGFFFAVGFLYLFSILFALLQAPLSYLHGVVREEGDRVKTATQFIIYFVSWPLLFFLYVMYAMLTVFIYFAYFISMVFGYYVSLGGIYFHVDPFYEVIGKHVEEEGNYKLYVPLVHIIVCGALLFCIIICAIVYGVSDDWEMVANAEQALSIFAGIYSLFNVIYVPIAFNHGRLPVEEAPAEPAKAAK